MARDFIGLLCLIMLVSANAEQPSTRDTCAAPGKTERWQWVYCMANHGNDSLYHPLVQRCLQAIQQNPPLPLNTPRCQQNAFWKAKVCQITFDKISERIACIKDKDFIPTLVQEAE